MRAIGSAWDTPVVDSHVHVFTTSMPLVGILPIRPAYSFTGEDLCRTLDEHGVPMALVSAAGLWGDYNDYTIDCLRRFPRLRGTVILQPTTERIVIDQMKRDGVVGVRLPFFGMDPIPDVTSFDYRRFFTRLADLDLHVHPHIEGEKLPDLLPLLANSGVKVVIDHIGRPNPGTGINSPGVKSTLQAVENGRTWVKLSAAFRLGPVAAEVAKELVRQAGGDRLVWASDCPFVAEEGNVAYQQTIDWLNDCVPDPEERRKIYCDTPLKLFFS
jgi:predicted TIM-barrel fold metal-dependent hydrolase